MGPVRKRPPAWLNAAGARCLMAPVVRIGVLELAGVRC